MAECIAIKINQMILKIFFDTTFGFIPYEIEKIENQTIEIIGKFKTQKLGLIPKKDKIKDFMKIEGRFISWPIKYPPGIKNTNLKKINNFLETSLVDLD